MKPRTNRVPRAQASKSFQGEGPNWILIAGGALLSTLSIRLGYKLKKELNAKEPENSYNGLTGNGKCTGRKKSGRSHLQSNGYCFSQDEEGCFSYLSGTQGMVVINQQTNKQLLTECDTTNVPATEFNKENSVIWASSPCRLELPQKVFHQSNRSESPCVSESGSDIFSKREVIQKLRQQLKGKDNTIMEMQDQIVELRNSLISHLSCSSDVQSLLDAANRDLLDSEREIQRLRKAIADYCVCVGQVDDSKERNVHHVNGYVDIERVEMLKREVVELKEVIEGKEYLMQRYKEHKEELSVKVKELQQRLDSQLPNIL